MKKIGYREYEHSGWIFSFYKNPDCFWFRIFGRGLSFFRSFPLFSERNGHVKYPKLWGNWRMKYLPKWDIGYWPRKWISKEEAKKMLPDVKDKNNG